MKKYIILFFLISIFNSYAGPPKTNLDTGRKISNFNDWLFENGHMQYLEINENYEECKNCNTWDAGPRCFEESGKPKKQCVLDGDQSYGEGGYKWIENISKNIYNYDGFSNPEQYGGQFHMGISGKRNTPIFIMDGFGGQTININFEDKKIISTLSIHRNYNWMKLVHEKL